MKKNILLALCCCSLLAFTGCSDDYTDATSKHIYGENENPYLKTNTNAQVTTNVAFLRTNIEIIERFFAEGEIGRAHV